MNGSFRLSCIEVLTGDAGGDSSVPDSGWTVTEGVTALGGADEEAVASGRAWREEVRVEVCNRPDEAALRGGMDGSCRSREVAMGSSCNSSPLKSVIIPLRVECHADSEDSLERGNGVVEEAAAMARLRSTSLTLILRRLLRTGAELGPIDESWVTVAVGDGVRARGCTSTTD